MVKTTSSWCSLCMMSLVELVLISMCFLVVNAVAANPVPIGNGNSTSNDSSLVQPLATCYARWEAASAASTHALTVLNLGCFQPFDTLSRLVQWTSVVPSNLTLTNYTSSTSWIQPSGFPQLQNGVLKTGDVQYQQLRRDCIINCSATFPNSMSVIVMLAYGTCYCAGGLSTISSAFLRRDCCDPLPLDGVDWDDSSASSGSGSGSVERLTNGSDVLRIVPMPSMCSAGQLYGQLIRAVYTCPLNASMCGAVSSCSLVDGCCSTVDPNSNVTPDASVESTAAQWLVALLLVAVVFQLGYWVVRLRLCRHRAGGGGGNGGENPGDRRRGRRRGLDEEMGAMDMDVLEQLTGIAQRMRQVLLRRQQQRQEPRRNKEEALDAANEALGLFHECAPEEVGVDDSCPMCLDDLKSQLCVRVLCGHYIHRECMKEFLAHKLVSYATPVTCPMCRATVLLQNSADDGASTPATIANQGDRAVVHQDRPGTDGGGGDHVALHVGEVENPLLWNDQFRGDEAPDDPQHANNNDGNSAAGGNTTRRRRSSRGRRFHVAQANLAVERLLENRRSGSNESQPSSEYVPPPTTAVPPPPQPPPPPQSSGAAAPNIAAEDLLPGHGSSSSSSPSNGEELFAATRVESAGHSAVVGATRTAAPSFSIHDL